MAINRLWILTSKSMREKPHLCFVSYKLWSYLGPQDVKAAGGAERQQSLLASELIDRGYPVSAVVGDYGQEPHVTKDGINILKSYDSNEKTDVNNIVNIPKLIKYSVKLASAIYRSNADIIYTRNSLYYPICVIVCKATNKESLIAISNDSDVNKSTHKLNDSMMGRVYDWALENADFVLSQTEYQQDALERNWGVESQIVSNGYTVPDKNIGNGSRDYFLWIGRANRKVKRPHKFIDLARKTPSRRFRLIVSPDGNEGYYNELKEDCEKIENITFEGFVPPNEIDEYYKNSVALVNTSTNEGFPNTFLEAWRYGRPVVSLQCDLHGTIESKNVGFVSKSTEKMSRVISNDDFMERCVALETNCRELVRQEYSITSSVNKILEIVEDAS